VLAAAAADPDAPVRQIPVLEEAERARLVEEWNDTAAPVPAVTVPELVAARAATAPDAVAVTSEGAFVTYGELDRLAGRLAGTLAAAGVGPDQVVAVLADRSVELVVALLAVLKSGASYLPVHPGIPPERAAWMLADAGVRVLLTDRDQDQPGEVTRLPITGGQPPGMSCIPPVPPALPRAWPRGTVTW
jgi:non-ribosomal peptide synthetase component F